MNANDIRKKYLDFFASKGHTIVASDSVVPKEDPTVLFTTAGMQQFKRQFLGHIEGYTRATTSQKCLRTDDLDKVGKTPVHHTFFEMLGNFSFGDYFKKEAIAWGWEFLTQTLQIPADKLWVSVYQEDAEAEAIWLNDIKIPKSRLVRLGDKDNFWPSEAREKGPNGPCGPCSEIFFDYGENPECPRKNQCDPSCSCGRFAEIWNLVFTQFNRKDGGVLDPLPGKNIDTGMGLERLVAVIQGKKSNFETDLFEPILKGIEKECATDNVRLPVTEKRVIADHLRAVTFAINDGVVPSNEGRGYVVKRLIIDISDILLRNGKRQPRIDKLITPVIQVMAAPYPELLKNENNIASVITKIEQAYIQVRKERIPQLKEQFQNIIHQSVDPQVKYKELGETIFRYRDTFGLTLETIKSTAVAAGVNDASWNEALHYFDNFMGQQKERSRANSKMTGDVFADAQLNLNVPKTQFLGYESLIGQGSKILKIFKENTEVNRCQTGDEIKIVLDKTPFYAESGGQIGDTGIIVNNDSLLRVTDTQKIADVFVHSAKVEAGIFSVDDLVQTHVDEERRWAIMRNHTATHLLQAALRRVLGNHVQQQGSLVAEDRLRFDFTHPKGISRDEIQQIEAIVNGQIMVCDPVQKRVMSLKEAKEAGALAFFAEKYKDTVRVVSIGQYSKELCGGTHIEFTGQIGLVKVVGESSVAQGIRRIEAITGATALKYNRDQERQLEEIANIIKAPVHEAAVRVNAQNARVKQLEKELENFRFEFIKDSLDDLLAKAHKVQEVTIVTHTFKDLNIDVLRKVADLIKQKSASTIACLGTIFEDNAFVLIQVPDVLVKKGIKANDLIKKIAPLLGGSGGGRPEMAQAGSKEIAKLNSAMSNATTIIKESLSL